jgi:hypothetical protein
MLVGWQDSGGIYSGPHSLNVNKNRVLRFKIRTKKVFLWVADPDSAEYWNIRRILARDGIQDKL